MAAPVTFDLAIARIRSLSPEEYGENLTVFMDEHPALFGFLLNLSEEKYNGGELILFKGKEKFEFDSTFQTIYLQIPLLSIAASWQLFLSQVYC